MAEQEFPRMIYHPDGRTRMVLTEDEYLGLEGEWYFSPADFGVITAPSEEEALGAEPYPLPYAPFAVKKKTEADAGASPSRESPRPFFTGRLGNATGQT